MQQGRGTFKFCAHVGIGDEDESFRDLNNIAQNYFEISQHTCSCLIIRANLELITTIRFR